MSVQNLTHLFDSVKVEMAIVEMIVYWYLSCDCTSTGCYGNYLPRELMRAYYTLIFCTLRRIDAPGQARSLLGVVQTAIQHC